MPNKTPTSEEVQLVNETLKGMTSVMHSEDYLCWFFRSAEDDATIAEASIVTNLGRNDLRLALKLIQEMIKNHPPEGDSEYTLRREEDGEQEEDADPE